MMRIAFVFILIFETAFSQETKTASHRSKNGVFSKVDLYTGTITLNYEKSLPIAFGATTFNLQTGIGITPRFSKLDTEHYSIPAGMSLMIGKRKGHLEIGADYSKFIGGSDKNNILNILAFRSGYRYQNLYRKGINFRAGLAPSIYTWWDDDYQYTEVVLDAYFGLGYHF